MSSGNTLLAHAVGAGKTKSRSRKVRGVMRYQ
jgi:hypothetical protein